MLPEFLFPPASGTINLSEYQSLINIEAWVKEPTCALLLLRLRFFLLLLLLLLQGVMSHAVALQLSMSVQVQGLGPRFRLLINLSNQGQTLATHLQVRTAGS